jgi:hypothetical protein
MANRSDRRFQTLIYPKAAIASREADEEKTRGFPSSLDALKSDHNEAEYTDPVQTCSRMRAHATPVAFVQGNCVHCCIASASALLREADADNVRLEADREHGAPELACDMGRALAAGQLSQAFEVFGGPQGSFSARAGHQQLPGVIKCAIIQVDLSSPNS